MIIFITYSFIGRRRGAEGIFECSIVQFSHVGLAGALLETALSESGTFTFDILISFAL